MGGSIILCILLVGLLGYLVYEKWEVKGLAVFAGAVAAVVVCALLNWWTVVICAAVAAVFMLLFLLASLAGMNSGTRKGCITFLAVLFVCFVLVMVFVMRSCSDSADAPSDKKGAVVSIESCDTLYGGVIDRVEYTVMADGSIEKDGGKGAYATDTVQVREYGGKAALLIDDHLLLLDIDRQTIEIVETQPEARHLSSKVKSVDWQKIRDLLDQRK